MINTRDIDGIIGSDAVDQDNDKIGKVGQIYLDSESDQPVWVTVKSGLFGTSETLVPLDGADWDSNALHLAFTKDRVKDAPRVEPDAELSPEEQDRLYDYYGISQGQGGSGQGGTDRSGLDQGSAGQGGADLSADAGRSGLDQGVGSTGSDDLQGRHAAGGDADYSAADLSDTGRQDDLDGGSGTALGDTAAASGAAGAGYDSTTTGAGRGADYDTTTTDRGTDYGTAGGSGGTVGRDTSGPTTDEAMTRSEERLNVGTQKVESGRVRLRKHVVTEQQTVTVPVTREEARLEREPITDANRDAAYDGPELSEEEHEVVLTEERPVVAKETVPVERVRLATEEVTEQRQVTEDVSHEEIEQVGDSTSGQPGDGDARR